MRSATILTAAGVLVIAFVVCVGAQSPAARSGASPASGSLPPVLQTCPMHPDVVEDKPGTCPLCKMALVPVAVDTVQTGGIVDPCRSALQARVLSSGNPFGGIADVGSHASRYLVDRRRVAR